MGERMTGGVLPGTVDLVILKALAERPLHGFGISRLLRRQSGGVVELQDAALYQALHRMARQGLLESEWGTSESNRRAKFYRLTPSGRKQLAREEQSFRTYVDGVLRILSPEGGRA
ncbi:MAG: PadR family transcriptional regulator [Gemmatimonadales bacterium]|jgi:transcriptional regulator|nr:MAG: PadR family transcriptional regulator [Gemmatimonadales bacterium]